MSRAWAAGSTRSWRRLRALILDRDGHRCRVLDQLGRECGAWASHVDHVTPRSAGGSDDPSNLRAACAGCNLRRGAGRDVVRPDGAPVPIVRRWSW